MKIWPFFQRADQAVATAKVVSKHLTAVHYDPQTQDHMEVNVAQERFWQDTMDFCGCYSHSLFETFFTVLRRLHEARKAEMSFYIEHEGVSQESRDLQELVLHALDAKKLIEHGVSVRGAWLSDAGLEATQKLFEGQRG